MSSKYISYISIHELHTELDAYRQTLSGFPHNRFQSTSSIRSSTPPDPLRMSTRPISIHELHTELDRLHGIRVITILDFNPRAPYGARLFFFGFASRIGRFQSTSSIRSSTAKSIQMSVSCVISIHELHTELDNLFRCFFHPFRISIHELHTELDSFSLSQPSRDAYFNPRAPYGARR